MTLNFAQVRQIPYPFDPRIAPAQLPARWQGVAHHRQAHRWIAQPDLRKNVFQRPFDGLKVGAILEVTDKQQALAVQRGLDVLVMRAVNAVDHHRNR
ncbi:hypothetical protein D9M71_580260 [compost metagenome]